MSRLVNRSLGGFIKDVCIERKRQKGAKWDREESRGETRMRARDRERTGLHAMHLYN